MRCGILAFQGDVAEHEQALARLGVKAQRITQTQELVEITHLIIPGGESTVIGAFLKESGMGALIQERVRSKTLAVFGTCAGAIVLANHVESLKPVESLQLIDTTISRNAYGSQINSFEDTITFEPSKEAINAVFIRAPKITGVGEGVTILAEHNGMPVLVRTQNILVSTFHPEYLDAPIIHRYFLGIDKGDTLLIH